MDHLSSQNHVPLTALPPRKVNISSEDEGISPSSQPSSSYRKYYQGAAGMIFTAITYTIYKRVGLRRRQWFLLSFISLLNNVNEKNQHNVRRFPGRIFGAEILEALHSFLKNFLRRPDYAHAEQSSLSFLRTAAQNGLVKRALIDSTEIFFSSNEGWKRTQLPSHSPGLQKEFIELLTRHGSDISALPKSFWSKVAPFTLTALPFVYLAFAYQMLKGLHNNNNTLDGENADFFSSKLLAMPKNNNTAIDNKKIISFSDVAGLDSILPEVKEIVSYLKDPLSYHAFGAEPPHGILLHGEPGTGKTLLSKAIAGEAECDAFCACSGSDFCEMYVGRGAARVRMLFKEARKVALKNYSRRQRLKRKQWLWPWGSTTPTDTDASNEERCSDNSCIRPATAIIFIDELDALAKSRSYDGTNSNDERDQTLNQLLTEMDGFQTDNVSVTVRNNSNYDVHVTVIVIAATNRPDVLDPAILRRFDRQVHVPFPDSRGRMDILRVHAAKTRCRFSTIHWDYLSEQTPNFSGSDLKQVVNDAALLAVRQESKHIEQGHLLRAIQRSRTMKVQKNNTGRSLVYSSSPMSTSQHKYYNVNQEGKEPPLLHPFLWYSEGEGQGRK